MPVMPGRLKYSASAGSGWLELRRASHSSMNVPGQPVRPSSQLMLVQS